MVRLIERSCSPPFTKLTISLRRVSGPTKSRFDLVKAEEPVLVGRQPEEIAFLLDPLDRGAGRRTEAPVVLFRKLALVVIGLVTDRVPSGVLRQVNVAIRLHATPQLLRRDEVIRIGRANEAVEGAVEPLAHLAELRRHLVDKGFGRLALAGRGLLDLQPVLVGAGQEEHVIAVDALEARDRVRRDHLVGMPDMGHAIRVGDGRGDVELLGHSARSPEGLRRVSLPGGPRPPGRRTARSRPDAGRDCRSRPPARRGRPSHIPPRGAQGAPARLRSAR